MDNKNKDIKLKNKKKIREEGNLIKCFFIHIFLF